MRLFSDDLGGLPLFSPFFAEILQSSLSRIQGHCNCDSHEAAAAEVKSIFASERDQEIFLTISKRYNQRQNAVDAQLQKQAEEFNRKYYAEFRRNALRTAHPDSVVETLLRQPHFLPREQYRPGLEKAYPMFYLTIGIQLFGLEKVSTLYRFCTL